MHHLQHKISMLFGFTLLVFLSDAQDTILHRIILIGDAGQINSQQYKTIENAAGRILRGKTAVFFLGDNIYPTGMGVAGSKTAERDQEILRSQFIPMRAKGAQVYFIPGNHDWDNGRVKGLENITYANAFLQQQEDSLLQMIPANGCPGPVEIKLSDSLVVIAFDSEWWLYPFNKNNPAADCDCKTKDQMIARLTELMYRNRHAVVLLADHHPFQSNGNYGGSFSWKDHIFPLTTLNKNLFLPLPVLGSLYPILRHGFANPQDLNHPLYKEMIKRVDETFALQPNRIHISGHEQGLQLLKGSQTQIISGSGSQQSFVKTGKNSLFASSANGYVTADMLKGNNLRFTFYVLTDSGFAAAFTYLQVYTPLEKAAEKNDAPITGDSITIVPHGSFSQITNWHRFLFGENYRKEYALPATLPVIRVSNIHGGLEPIKLGGGNQSRSLRMKDSNGKEWVLRSVEKYPEVILPDQLQESFAATWLNDAISAQHPFAALLVPPIANAVKVPHTNPIIGFIAPDKRLGIYAKQYANKPALLEEREPGGKSDPTGHMLSELNKDNDNSIDRPLFFRARLLDLFLGDWDRHDDQWRWLDIQKGKNKRIVACITFKT